MTPSRYSAPQAKVNADLAALVADATASGDWAYVRGFFSHDVPTGTEEAQVTKICKVMAWGRFFLPTYLRDASPPFHYEILEKIFSRKNEYWAAPRGFSKTTLNQLAMCYKVANQEEKFIVVVEKSFREAAEVLEMVRKTFADERMVKQVYGCLVKADATGATDEKNKDAQGDLFINGVRLRAKGFNAPIRGLKSAEWRPTLIIVDDVETDEHIGNEDQRRKYRENYSQGIVPSLDIDVCVKVMGTILHYDSLLKNLVDHHGGSIYRAYDPMAQEPASTLLWPERWPWDVLERKRLEMEMEGQGSSKFHQEFLNQPIDDLRRDFRQEWTRKYFTEADVKFKALYRTVCIDPAESKSRGADYTAVTVVDTDQENNWFVRHVKRHRVNSAELIDLIFELWRTFSPQTIGIEKKAFEDQIKPYLQIKSQETGVFPAVVELEHKGQRKEDRIRGALQGRFESGKIYLMEGAKDDTRLLQGELYDFPFGKNDDLADSLAYHSVLAKRPYGGRTEHMPSNWKELLDFRKKKRGDSLAVKL